MREKSLATALTMLLAGTAAAPASAATAWQKPTVQECTLGPGAECNVEATCPAAMPYVAAGGGGIPKIAPADNQVAMTMNLPVKEGTWRVRWRNLSADQTVTGKFAVRIKCSDSAAEAGW